jgi:hypothetical protein
MPFEMRLFVKQRYFETSCSIPSLIEESGLCRLSSNSHLALEEMDRHSKTWERGRV